MIDDAQVKEIASRWARFMGLDPDLFEVGVGDFNSAFFDADADKAHVHAGTFGNLENTRFIVAIRPTAPAALLEQIIVHELVHVYTFSNCGGDARANMELATDQLATMIRRVAHLENCVECSQTSSDSCPEYQAILQEVEERWSGSPTVTATS